MTPIEGIGFETIEDSLEKAQILLMERKAGDALELLRRLGPGGQALWSVRNKMGVCLVMLGRTAEAEAEFRAAISINPDCSPAYTNMGNLSREKGDPQRAIEYYEKAIQADPTYSNAYHNLGSLYISEKRYDKGIPLVKTAKQLELGKGDLKRGKRKQLLWRYSWVAVAFVIGAAIMLLIRNK